MTSALRIVIADDHPVYREGLRTLLTDIGAEVVGEAADGAAAVTAAEATRPDVVLMDLTMPTTSGIEATKRLARTMPDLPVLVLTMSEDSASLQAALAAGARGYLLKEAGKADIALALDAVVRGEVVVGAGMSATMRTLMTGVEPPQARDGLTAREREIAGLLARGLDNAAIAARLFLAPKTVRNRVSDVIAKLGAASRAEAVARARDAGFGI